MDALSPTQTPPNAREAIVGIGLGVPADYSGVTDLEAAETVLSSLVAAATDIILGTGIHSDPIELEAKTTDPDIYMQYPHSTGAVAELASLLGEFVCDAVAEALTIEAITGQGIDICLRALTIVIDGDETPDGTALTVVRLDLDPDASGGVDIHSPLDPELFADIATAFALYSHHLITDIIRGCGGGYSAMLSVID